MSAMIALAPRIASVAAEHQALEVAIHRESRRVDPDFARVAALKKRKLALKDAIAILKRRAGGKNGRAAS